MANNKIQFKRGLQASYNSLATKDADSFYITTDTNRLYLGSELLSQAVVVVSSIANLPDSTAAKAAPGQIYYVESVHALAVWDDNSNDWVQLNTDTDIYYVNDNVALVPSAGSDVSNSVKLGASINAYRWVDGTKDATATITETAAADMITMVGASGTKVSYNTSNKTITVTGSQYSLGRGDNAGEIVLTGSGASAGTSSLVKLVEGDNVDITNGSTAGQIVISATDTTLKQNSGNTNSAENYNALSFDASGNLTVTIKDTQGDIVETAVSPTITLGTNSTPYNFVSGTATLPVYTKTEIDKKLFDVDAMSYIGALDSDDEIPSDLHIGDTFKISTSYTSSIIKTNNASTSLKVNDIVIVNSDSEEVNGKIAKSSASWDVIHCGDAANSEYSFAGTMGTNSFELELTETNTSSSEGTFKLTGDSYVTLEADGTVGAKIKHVAAGAGSGSVTSLTEDSSKDVSQTAGSSATATVVTGVTRDSAGHVSGVNTSTISVVDTKISQNDFTAAVAVASNKATVTLSDEIRDNTIAAGADGYVGSDAITIAGDKFITVTADGTKGLTLTHVAAGSGDGTVATVIADDTNDVTQERGGNATATVVTGITRDNAGHIKGVQTSQISMVDSAVAQNDVTLTASVTNNVATITATNTITDNKSGAANTYVGEDTLTLTGSGNVTLSASTSTVGSNTVHNINIDLVWGTF